MRSMVEGFFRLSNIPSTALSRGPPPPEIRGRNFQPFPSTPIAAVTIASIPVSITVSASGAQ
jgi:hypothetical protein